MTELIPKRLGVCIEKASLSTLLVWVCMVMYESLCIGMYVFFVQKKTRKLLKWSKSINCLSHNSCYPLFHPMPQHETYFDSLSCSQTASRNLWRLIYCLVCHHINNKEERIDKTKRIMRMLPVVIFSTSLLWSRRKRHWLRWLRWGLIIIFS